MPSLPRSLRRVVPLAVVLLGAVACAPVVDVDPAADAQNPACADVMVALPPDVAEQSQRETNSQATSAWGDPSKVVLRCGVDVPGPTTDACVSVNDIDWVLREGDGAWTATTYGRDPAVEVLFDPEQVASSTVLVQLGDPVSKIAQTRKCLSLSDQLDLPADG
jgi:hypothetical protein